MSSHTYHIVGLLAGFELGVGVLCWTGARYFRDDRHINLHYSQQGLFGDGKTARLIAREIPPIDQCDILGRVSAFSQVKLF